MRPPNLSAPLALATILALSGCGATLYDAQHAPAIVPVCTSDAQPIACVGASACVAEDDNHCGTGCNDCLANPVQHGATFCDRTNPDLTQHACVTSCEPGFVRDPNGPGCICDSGQVACGAGGVCVAETVASCGASCQACGAPAGATPTCSSHACDYICPGGKVQCTNAAGQADCCVPACGPQQIQCGAACVSESTTQCGPRCLDCSASSVPANASPACLGPAGQGACTFACNPGFLKSNGACVRIASGPSSVALGATHTCAITTSGQVMCWGNNGSGQLGVGDTANRLTPADVPLAGGATARSISAGSGHTCVVTTTGSIQCWGSNATGQLGLPLATASRLTPTAVSNLAAVDKVAAGAGHTCALLQDGAVQCWGANDKGQVGSSPGPAPVTTPTPVNLSGPSSLIATQADHTCVVKGTNGQVSCWGWNRFGQTGQSQSEIAAPGGTVSSLTASAISVGGTHTCAIGTVNNAAPGVYCWGDRSARQLGDGLASPNSSVPIKGVLVDPGSNADRILTGHSHTCARGGDGTVTCAGANLSLQTGQTPPSTSVLQGPSISLGPVDALFGGGDRSCALVAGTLECWGANDHGQLGNNSTAETATPVSPQPF